MTAWVARCHDKRDTVGLCNPRYGVSYDSWQFRQRSEKPYRTLVVNGMCTPNNTTGPSRNGHPDASPTGFDALLRKIQDHDAVVGVIGLGYVGLPLSHTLHKSGFSVVGYDTDPSKIEALKNGESYIRHIPKSHVESLAESPKFTATGLFDAVTACDVIIICLPTPVGPHEEPDMSYVLSTTRKLAPLLCEGALVVLESTTYPGATDTDLASILSQGGTASLGTDFFLAFSPEREDPGNKDFQTSNIPKLVGGVDAASGTLAEAVYKEAGFASPVRVSSARVAECAKLLENTYRAVNIALVNELKGVFSAMDVDIFEVLDAAATKPFGFSRFDPGPGIGGHCIPVDPFYLAWKARECGKRSAFIELAARVNASMPGRVVQNVQRALNDQEKAVNGARVLLLGVAYKAEVDDIRESPALQIWDEIREMGGKVSFHDPYVQVICRTRKHAALTGAVSVGRPGSGKECSDLYDAVVVLTNHMVFADYAFLDGFQGPVVDTRNCVPRTLRVRMFHA